MRSIVLLFFTFLFFLGLFLFFFRWSVQQEIPVVGEPPPMPTPLTFAELPGLRVREVAADLGRVRALEVTPDGRVFVAERSGRIRVMRGEEGTPAEDPESWLTLEDVASVEAGGLMDLAYREEGAEGGPALYAFVTAPVPGLEGAVIPGDGRPALEGRIVRVPVRGEDPGEPEVVREGLPAGPANNGGRLVFGPDGLLYASVGDVGEPGRAQRLDDPAGAILRLTPDGDAAADNPWGGSAAGAGRDLLWAVGFRDVTGLAWHPETGSLFAADRGPAGEWEGIEHLDEVNIAEAGGNYGWPRVVGAPGLDGFRDPWLAWVPGHPPGDLAFTGEGDLLMTVVAPAAVLRVTVEVEEGSYVPRSIERWVTDEVAGGVFREPRALAVAPDGDVYLSLGSGEDPSGDRILVLRPEGLEARPRGARKPRGVRWERNDICKTSHSSPIGRGLGTFAPPRCKSPHSSR